MMYNVTGNETLPTQVNETCGDEDSLSHKIENPCVEDEVLKLIRLIK